MHVLDQCLPKIRKLLVSSPDLIRRVYRFQYNVQEYWKWSALGLVLDLGPRLFHCIPCGTFTLTHLPVPFPPESLSWSLHSIQPPVLSTAHFKHLRMNKHSQNYNQHLNSSAATLSSQLFLPHHTQFSQVTIPIQICTWYPTFLEGFSCLHSCTPHPLPLSPPLAVESECTLHKAGRKLAKFEVL